MLRMALALSLLATVVAYKKPASSSNNNNDDDEDEWSCTDTFRAVIDVLNLLVLVAEHCHPSAPPGECVGFLIMMAVTALGLILVCACCACLGITCDKDRTIEDGARMVALGHSVDVLSQCHGYKCD